MGERNCHTESKESTELVADLHRLLVEQVRCAREGDLSHVEQLIESADAVVTEIVRQEGGPSAVLGSRRGELEELYAELILMLTAEQADIGDQLRQLRRMKTAVGLYRADHG